MSWFVPKIIQDWMKNDEAERNSRSTSTTDLGSHVKEVESCSTYNSRTEYLADVNNFVTGVQHDLGENTRSDDEQHWSDIQLFKGIELGLLGTVSEMISGLSEEGTRLKITFTYSVLMQFFKMYAVSTGHFLLPWYYLITTPLLVAHRIYSYLKIQRHFFCLDYCYFGNLAVLLIMIFAPGNPQLFILQFCIGNGLLYTGAFSFRNSLVFHSVDKMTSTYIHSAPVLLTFGVRWFPEEASRYWYKSFPTEFPEWNVKWSVIAPLVFVLCHVLFYTVLVYGILKPPAHVITSYRYLKGKAAVHKLIPRPRFYHFIIGQVVVVIVMTGVNIITYTYYLAHLAQVLLLLVVVTWNAAGYYVDVFRMSLVRQPKPKNKKT